MNPWLFASAVLTACLIPCLIATLRGDPVHRLVALEAAGNIVCLVLVALSEGLHRGPFMDLALALALVDFAGCLTFARFFERWL